MKKIILFLIICTFLSYIVSATCTVTFDRSTNYSSTETINAEMICDSPSEKSQVYTLTWRNCTNGNGAVLEIDTGTTPSTEGINFYEDYVIPSTFTEGCINATLTGNNLEGFDETNVSGASGNTLIISDNFFGGGYIGLVSSITATVKDENGKLISGGICKISGWSNDETRMLLYQDTQMLNGEVKVADILQSNRFEEGTQYAYKIICMCGSDGGAYECIDEDGIAVEDSTGIIKGSFETLSWLEVNTLTDKQNYIGKEEIFICSNVTNINYTERISLQIYHQLRCSAGEDLDSDLDRVLIISDDNLPDYRGISVSTTQMQCKRFVIPEANYLQGRNSECYASTDVIVLDRNKNQIISYSTTSPVINISISDLNINPDWQHKGGLYFNTIINLSERNYERFNGTGMGNIDIRIEKSYLESIRSDEQNYIYQQDIDNFNKIELIKNITAYNKSGGFITTTIEILDDGHIELELRDVDITKEGWYNVSIEFYNLNERRTEAQELAAEALQNISDKTGTFHFDIKCPKEVYYGDTRKIECVILGYIESGEVEKEVDMDCYIDNGMNSINFNQMYTSSPLSIRQELSILDLGMGYHTATCKANYFNLGSRTDTFSDSFYIFPGEEISNSQEAATVVGAIKEDIKEDIEKIDSKKIGILLLVCLITIGIIKGKNEEEYEEERIQNNCYVEDDEKW